MPEWWAPGGTCGSPTYSMPIKVVDGVRSTLIGKRRRLYVAAMKRALGWWGLPFELSYRPESEQAYVVTDESAAANGNGPLIIPDAVVIVRAHFATVVDTAGWIDEFGGGICLITPWRGWWTDRRGGQIASLVAHEFGHTLGFCDHAGKGSMAGGGRVSDEERQLVATYYGV